MVISTAPSLAAQPVSIRTEFGYLCVLFVWFAAAAIFSAGVEVPVIDDWTYAWSVELLLRTGRFDVLDFSAVYPLASTLWGSLWASLFGFSFATLRLSTLSLGFVATAALYMTVRELGASRGIALLGAYVMAANPTFFLLASSFMTDVPFVAFTMLALLYYVRAGSRGRVTMLWWAGFWSLAALLNRQIGFVTPIAGLPLLLHSSRDPVFLPRRHVVIALGFTWLVMAVSWAGLMSVVAPTTIMVELSERLRYLLLVPFTGYVVATLNMAAIIAFHALPALLALASLRSRWRWAEPALLAAAALAVLLAAISPVDLLLPLQPGSVWSIRELGMPRGLLRGEWTPNLPAWILTVVRGGGFLAIVLCLAALVPRFRWPPFSLPDSSDDGRRWAWLEPMRAAFARTRSTPVIAFLAAYVVLTNVLWFYHDRYWVPMLFAVVILVLGRRTIGARPPVFAWCVVVVFAAVALMGTRDTLRFNEAVRDSWKTLVARGVPPSDIDAGYSWNGWMLYAHPENLAKGQKITRDVPMISTMKLTPYMLAMSPMKDYVVERRVMWDDSWWPNPDHLFVLKRAALSKKPPADSAQ
jgi:hypothetical protein